MEGVPFSFRLTKGERAVRRGSLFGTLALACFVSVLSPTVSSAQLLRTITVTPAPVCSPLISVGVAFDGSELLVSCIYNFTVTRVRPADGAVLGSYAVSGMLPGDGGIGAMSWDADVGQLWVGSTLSVPQHIYKVLLSKTLGTGVATLVITHTAGGFSIMDGVAYDGTDPLLKFIWMSPDVSDTIYKYSTAGGAPVFSKSGLTAALGGNGNSGIAVANSTVLYLANDGGSQIYSWDKAFTGSPALFATLPARVEDLECDNTTFAPGGAIWSKDAFDWILRAFAVPAGQCAQGGVPPPPADAPIVAKGTTFGATEGTLFVGTVAMFSDPDPNSTAAEYTASIHWGDSTTSSGTISGMSGSFTVSGTHTYVEEGTYKVTVTITDVDNPKNNAQALSTAIVGDGKLSSRCATPPVSTQTYSGPTAVFTDQSSTGTLSDFSATIDWGDSTTSAGTITGGPGNAPYTVSGTHTYASTGTFLISTTITDVGGNSTTTPACSVIIFAFANSKGASFVIGDLEAGVGNHVTWWSSQWANINLMSGGAPPDAMKGFAGFEDNFLGLPPPNCGGTWSTDTGNSTPPPPSVPQFMGVIVSSKVTQSGSVISGDIKQVVILKNDPGYAPSPGHPGTGTEIAIACMTP